METSALSLAGAALRASRRHAIVYVLAASATFTVGSALVKALTAEFPVLEIVMFRSIVAFVAMLPMIIRHGGLSALATRRPVGHAMRTVYGFIGTVTSVYGFGVLPLVTVTALGFAMPLFLTIMSVPLLGERVGPRRATAVLVGLGGVLIMLRPWHGDGGSMPLGAVAIVLAGVVAWSLSMINIRQMGAAGEKNVTIVAWYSLGTASLAAFGCIAEWVTPSPWQFALLVSAGLFSGVAQLLMTEGYRAAETTLVAPFEYGAII
jgi:drug/metabolite transporter (DMT)-like permease